MFVESLEIEMPRVQTFLFSNYCLTPIFMLHFLLKKHAPHGAAVGGGYSCLYFIVIA